MFVDEAAHLHESRTDGEIKTRSDKEDDQDVIRQVRIDGDDDVEQSIFHGWILLWL